MNPCKHCGSYQSDGYTCFVCGKPIAVLGGWLERVQTTYFGKGTEVEFKVPQLTWIAKQYPNKGTWWSACDRFSIHVTDQGRFYACMAEWATKPYPWDGDNEFDTFSETTGYCEKYTAQLSSVKPKEET